MSDTTGTLAAASPAAIYPDKRRRTLPYGNTLHYMGCGCPTTWVRGARVADLVDLVFLQCHALYKQSLLPPLRPLRVAYMLPHHNITGGMKCLVEHLRLLKARGHTTIAVHRSDTAKTAMPPWADLKADVDIVCTLSQKLTDVYPADQIDVVLVGIFHQIAELLAGVPAPVVYWEQGHEWVFGDPIRLQSVQNYIKQDQLFHMCMHLPIPLISVSTAIQDILLQEFGRHSIIVPNGIDCDKFHPKKEEEDNTKNNEDQNYESKIGGENSNKPKNPYSILIVGNPALPLKGFDIALTILSAVNKMTPVHVTWICQIMPTSIMLPMLETCNLNINFVVAPAQKDIPELYRGHDLFLFTSRYEAWGMPVLEAMASGLPILTTDCFGIRTFCKHGYNCFIGDPNDLNTLANYVLQLLTDEPLRKALGKNARETALKFSPNNVIEHLEAVLYSLTACSQDLFKVRQYCLLDLQIACTWAAEACSRPRRVQ